MSLLAFFGGFGQNINLGSYDEDTEENREWMETRAIQRDNTMTTEEIHVKEETLRVCTLGPEYWLRAHP